MIMFLICCTLISVTNEANTLGLCYVGCALFFSRQTIHTPFKVYINAYLCLSFSSSQSSTIKQHTKKQTQKTITRRSVSLSCTNTFMFINEEDRKRNEWIKCVIGDFWLVRKGTASTNAQTKLKKNYIEGRRCDNYTLRTMGITRFMVWKNVSINKWNEDRIIN